MSPLLAATGLPAGPRVVWMPVTKTRSPRGVVGNRARLEGHADPLALYLADLLVHHLQHRSSQRGGKQWIGAFSRNSAPVGLTLPRGSEPNSAQASFTS